MKDAKLGDLTVARIGLGAMGMSHGYTGAGTDDAESIRTIHRALDLGVTLHRHRRDLRPLRQRGTCRPGTQGPPRRRGAGHQIRSGLSRRGRSMEPGQQPGQRPRRGRGFAAAARHRPHRPVLPTPRRPQHPDRGHHRRRRRTGRRGQGSPHRAVGGLGRHHPPGARRAPDHRAAVGVLAVDPRPGARGAAAAARTRHRLRAVFAARHMAF